MNIEKGIEIPKATNGAEGRYPWADMEHGDSFFVECEPDEHVAVKNRLTTAGYRWLKRNREGWRVSVRSVEGGVRIWVLDPSVES